MSSRKTFLNLIKSNGIAFSLILCLFLLVMGAAQYLTGQGRFVFLLQMDVANLVVAFISALLLFFYAYYNKKKYIYVLSLGVLFGSIVEYKKNLFLVDGEIDATFLGFYLIVFILVTFIMMTALTYTRVVRLNLDAMIIITLVLILFYFILTKYVPFEPLVFTDGNLWVIELFMLASIPFFFGWYFSTFVTKKNSINLSIYLSSLSYFVSMSCYSIFQRTLDFRFLFSGEIFETLAFGIYLLFIPLALYEIIREKDDIIEKSDVLKNNLFMFFKSAEYNENITVFVNSKHEILYSNSKYKIFFNNYGKVLDGDMSRYLTDKYEIIKYNMNYSSSIKILMSENNYILDVDVVYIEQDDEEIFCITAKDITVIRAMQESLERSEYKYRSFFNLIPDFIFLYDIGKNRVIEANDMVYNDFKLLPSKAGSTDPQHERFMGMTFKELNEIGEKINSGEILKLDIMRIQDHKGADVFVEPNFRLISFDQSKRQMLVFLRNVTNSVRLHELRIENEANIRKLYIARENEKMFNEFFANMSHELRTPINVILSALDMMEISEFDPVKSKKYGGLIRHNSYRLTRIVTNILDITKVDSGFYKLYMVNTDIVSFTEDIVMSILHYAEGKGLRIIFDTEVEEHIVAFDIQSLERVILNLLSNAIKFTKEGGSIFVNLSLDPENEKVYIDVQDTGIGISADNVDKIFDRFIQVNKSTTRDNEGTGIGLSIVKKLMNLMDGDCIVSSELDKGTTFRLILKDKLVEESLSVDHSKDFYNRTSKRVDIEFSDLKA